MIQSKNILIQKSNLLISERSRQITTFIFILLLLNMSSNCDKMKKRHQKLSHRKKLSFEQPNILSNSINFLRKLHNYLYLLVGSPIYYLWLSTASFLCSIFYLNTAVMKFLSYICAKEMDDQLDRSFHQSKPRFFF